MKGECTGGVGFQKKGMSGLPKTKPKIAPVGKRRPMYSRDDAKWLGKKRGENSTLIGGGDQKGET